MTNFILSAFVTFVVSGIEIAYSGDVTVDTKHGLTTEEQYEIYE